MDEEDLLDMLKTLRNNAAHMDQEALQQGIELLREIRAAYVSIATQLNSEIQNLEEVQRARS